MNGETGATATHRIEVIIPGDDGLLRTHIVGYRMRRNRDGFEFVLKTDKLRFNASKRRVVKLEPEAAMAR